MDTMSSPLKTRGSKNKNEKQLALFKKVKLFLTKSEAKKVLNSSLNLSYHQIEWVQRWLEQRVRERCLPPQLSGADAFSCIGLFLDPRDAISLLEEIRSDFQKMNPKTEIVNDYPIDDLQNTEYHSYLPYPS